MTRIERRRERLNEHKENFDSKMYRYLVECYPIGELQDDKKMEIYRWIISYYVVESAIYPVVNNTMRFALNSEKFRPISPYTQFLYEAVRFYFLNHYREINYRKLYRSSRVSLIEQRSFTPGKYLWNLGFMSTSID